MTNCAWIKQRWQLRIKLMKNTRKLHLHRKFADHLESNHWVHDPNFMKWIWDCSMPLSGSVEIKFVSCLQYWVFWSHLEPRKHLDMLRKFPKTCMIIFYDCVKDSQILVANDIMLSIYIRGHSAVDDTRWSIICCRVRRHSPWMFWCERNPRIEGNFENCTCAVEVEPHTVLHSLALLDCWFWIQE